MYICGPFYFVFMLASTEDNYFPNNSIQCVADSSSCLIVFFFFYIKLWNVNKRHNLLYSQKYLLSVHLFYPMFQYMIFPNGCSTLINHSQVCELRSVFRFLLIGFGKSIGPSFQTELSSFSIIRWCEYSYGGAIAHGSQWGHCEDMWSGKCPLKFTTAVICRRWNFLRPI